MKKLLEQADKGEFAALPTIKQLLNSHPELWQMAGDLAVGVERLYVGLFTGQDLLGQEIIRRKLAELKEELAGGSPSSPIEKMVISRIGISWLQVHLADQDAAEARKRDGGATTLSLYAQRRLDSAHRRYLMALKQLALIRRLLIRGKAQGRSGGRSKITTSS